MADDFGIGLGAMGYGMASNLRKKMHKEKVLYIYDINFLACKKFKMEFEGYGSIEITGNAKDTAEHSIGVVSILPSAAVVRETFLNKTTGLVAAGKDEGRILLECSTIDSISTQDIGTDVMAQASGVYVDGPVSVSGGLPHDQ